MMKAQPKTHGITGSLSDAMPTEKVGRLGGLFKHIELPQLCAKLHPLQPSKLPLRFRT